MLQIALLLLTTSAAALNPSSSDLHATVQVRAVHDKAVDSDKNKVNPANKHSPYDNSGYDNHKIDNEDVYHAPKVAPNAPSEDNKKPNPDSANDYNPSRLGINHEIESTTTTSHQVSDSGKTAPPKDPVKAVEDNKADSHKNKNVETKHEYKENYRTEKAKDVLSSVKGAPAVVQDSKGSKDIKQKPNAKQTGKPAKQPAKQPVTTDNDAHSERFLGSAIMIIVSEIGDKTFFIAALMAMRYAPLFVFSSSYSAMVVMTVLSMVLGLILPSLLSRKVTTLLAALLFFVFGFKMVSEAWSMDKNLAATDEMEEVEHDIQMQDNDKAMNSAEMGGNLTSVDSKSYKLRSVSFLSKVLSPVWIQIFAMTFLGEWGDRSQIATVAMGAGDGWVAVLMGCLLGHFITTLIAVLGGKILAQHLSLRTITFSGALCFLLFGVFYLKDWVEETMN